MLTLLFIICMFGIFGKLFCFGMKAAWGISKFILTIVFLPVICSGCVSGSFDIEHLQLYFFLKLF